MLTEKSVQGQNHSNRGCICTENTYQELNIGDCKMNFGEELKGTQVNQNNEENVAVIGKGKSRIRNKDTKDLGNATKIVIEDGAMEIEDSAFMRFGNLKEVILPESMTKIGARAFGGCEKLVQIGLNNGITQIGEFAFSSCKGLKGISLPGSIQKLGRSAFYDCENLEKVELGNGITEVFGNAFKNCNNLKEITLPGSIQTIEGYAFKDLKGLERVRLGDGTTTISENAFRDCGNLKEISLPQSIKAIYRFAFKDCKNLTKVESSLDLNVCDIRAFYGCQKLDLSGSFKFNIEDQHYDIEDNRFVYKGSNSLVIDDKRDVPLFGKDGPDENDISQGAMGDCWLVGALASISHCRQDVIKNMIKDNEDGTADVTLHRELMPGIFRKETYTVRKSVFGRRSCGTNLKMMSKSNETLWAQMVEKAYAAYLARGNESIDYNAIKGGGGGEKVAFRTLLGKESNKDYDSKRLKGDKKELFQKIKRALNSGTPLWYAILKLTSGIKDTDGDKVWQCHAYSIMGAYENNDRYYLRLRNPWGYNGIFTHKSAYITVDLEEATNVPFKISNLGLKDDKPAEGAENSALQDDEEGVDLIGHGREVITSEYAMGSSWASKIAIVDGVKTIGECAFINFNNLKKITISASVEKIERCILYGCENLEEIELKNGIKEISDEAFRNIKNLKTISIPGSVEKIGNFAFAGCEGLEEIELSDGIKGISERAFKNISNLKKITIPGSVEKIENLAFNKCEHLEEIELKDGIKEISPFAFNECTGLKRISIPGSVEKIDRFAFSDCENLEEVEIKNSATQIDSNAFDACKKLDLSKIYKKENKQDNAENQNEEEKATVIEKEVITQADTKSLKNVSNIVIKDGAREISGGAFKNLRNLRKISIPGSIEKIGNFVFDGCDNLEEVELKDGIREIPTCAFEGLTKLKKINLPGSIDVIGKFAFSRCESLEEIDIDNNTKKICDHAFDGCKGLREIRLPGNVYMGKDVFKGCSNIESVCYKKVEKAE